MEKTNQEKFIIARCAFERVEQMAKELVALIAPAIADSDGGYVPKSVAQDAWLIADEFEIEREKHRALLDGLFDKGKPD